MALLAGSHNGSNGEEVLTIGESSFLQSAVYSASALQLTVVFKTGQQHVYYGVYPNVWQAWKEASSKGKYYAEAIKGKFGGVKTVDKTVGKPVGKPLRHRLTLQNRRPK